MIPAIMAMIKAFIQLQSKKCLISANQTIIIIIVPTIEPSQPPKKKPMTAPITTPRTPIHTASVNFALSLPTNHFPTIHSTGASITAATTICINKDVRSILFNPTLYSNAFPFKVIPFPVN